MKKIIVGTMMLAIISVFNGNALAGSLFDNIDNAAARGEIDLETALLMKAAAATGKSHTFYKGFAAVTDEPALPRSLTFFALQVVRNWGRLSPYAKSKLSAFALGPMQAANYESEHFAFYYGPSVPPASFVNNYADYLEASWVKEVDVAGFTSPVDSGKMNIIIANTGLTDSYGEEIALDAGIYGYATVEYDSLKPFMVVNDDYSWATAGYSSDPDDWVVAMQATAAHEFQHCTQFALGAGLYGESRNDAWLMEATAVWCEDYVFDAADDYLQYLSEGGGWPTFPNLSLLYFNGMHEYGDVILAKYLTEHYAGDYIIANIWDEYGDNERSQKYNSSLYSIDQATLSLESVLKGFVVKNAVMDYEEGANYGRVTIAKTVETYPQSNATIPLKIYGVSAYPDILGSNYIKFVPTDSSALTLSFDGSVIAGAKWSVMVVGILSDRIAGYWEMPLIGGAGQLTIDPFESTRFDYLLMVPQVMPSGDLLAAVEDFHIPAPITMDDPTLDIADYPQGHQYTFSAVLSAGGSCIDLDADGYGENCSAGSDCDDDDASINPGQTEIVRDGVDNDCDLSTTDIDSKHVIPPTGDDDDDDSTVYNPPSLDDDDDCGLLCGCQATPAKNSTTPGRTAGTVMLLLLFLSLARFATRRKEAKVRIENRSVRKSDNLK